MKQLKLSFLGGFQVTGDDKPISYFRSHKAQALLAYLAVESDRAHQREALAELLWNDMPGVDALRNLRQTLFRLRRALGDDGDSSAFFHISTQAIQFLPSEHVTIDVREFNSLLHRARERDDPNNVELLAGASALYRGDLLAGFFISDSPAFEEWVIVRREELHQSLLDALALASAQALERGNYAPVIRFARRQVELEPWREVAHRQLMRALVLDGQRDAALAQYESCRRLLDQEMGIAPEMETELLVERIRRGELTPRALTAQTYTNNLPATLTPFVGRTAELTELVGDFAPNSLSVQGKRAVEPVRLLTLLGPGGIGKTRLALAVAAKLLESFSDGVFFVELAAVEHSFHLVTTIAKTLQVPLMGTHETVYQLLDFLRPKQLLLVLDNLEQLVDATTREFVVSVLHTAPQVQVLITSRVLLGVQSEKVHDVEGLDVAGDDSLQQVAESDAAQLFMSSTRRRQTGVNLTNDNRIAVQRICRAVAGMPLALELAASWSSSLALADIADEIEASADILVTEEADIAKRQQSMRAVFESTWRLLDDTERSAFQQLAYLRGGFTREAAARVAGASPFLLKSLIGKSYLRLERGADSSTGRYQIHELLRQYGQEKLSASPVDFANTPAAHGHYFMHWLAQRVPRQGTSETGQVVAEIMRELPNLRTAFGWAAEAQAFNDLEPVIQGWGRFCHDTGLLAEGDVLLERIQARAEMALAEAEGGSARDTLSKFLCNVLRARGDIAFHAEQYPQAIALLLGAIELAEQMALPEHLLFAHLTTGYVVWRLHRHAEAQEHFQSVIALTRSREINLPGAQMRQAEYQALRGLAMMQLFAGRPKIARDLIITSLEIARVLNDTRALNLALSALVLTAIIQNDLQMATLAAEEQLAVSTAGNDKFPRQNALANLGTIHKNLGDYRNALQYLEQAEKMAIDLGIRGVLPLTLFDLGNVTWQLGDSGAARVYWARGLAIAQEIGERRMEVSGLMHHALLFYMLRQYNTALDYGERARTMAVAIGEPYVTCDTLVVLGKVRARLGHYAAARESLAEALARTHEMGLKHLHSEIESELAWVALGESNSASAQQHVQAALQLLDDHSVFACLEPFQVHENCYGVLKALGDPLAEAVVQTLQRLRAETAQKLPEGSVRENFLQKFRQANSLISMTLVSDMRANNSKGSDSSTTTSASLVDTL